jgi:histidyl-tRNA synthetase
VSGGLGAQNSVLGGGRYDGLVKDLGGPDLTGIGFALGMERLVMLLPAAADGGRCDVFLAPLAAAALDKALLLQRELRRVGVRVLTDYEGRGLKAKMKLADKLGARYVAILGDSELAKGVWTVRDMRTSTQEDVAEARAADHLKERTHG